MMKKRFAVLLAFILVLAFVFVGCSTADDSTEEGYKEIKAKQKNEYATKLNALMETLATKSLKTVGTVTTEKDETGEKTVTTKTLTVDCTDPDNPKVIESILIRYETENGESTFSLTAYEADDSDDTTPIEIQASAPGKEDYSFRGKVEDVAIYLFPYTAANGINWVCAVFDLLDALDEMEEESGVKVYVDGNKMKATFDTATEVMTKKGEVEAVLDADVFECRISLNRHYISNGETEIEEGRVCVSNETVEIPSSGYDEPISPEDFFAVMEEYLGT